MAGGESKRFGSNKAFALLDGIPLVEHVVGVVSGIFRTCVLVTNTPEQFAYLNVPMIGDLYHNAGPLAGIHAALTTIEEPAAFVAGCDMPFLEEKVIRYLQAVASGWDVVIPWLANGPEPICAVYHKSALPVIKTSLENGGNKISDIFDRLRVRRVTESEILALVPNLSSFRNINYQEDLYNSRN